MNNPSSLIDSIDDPRRRDAENKLTKRERKTIVKLEGTSDVDFFKEFGQPSSHIYQTLGENARRNGKMHIIKHVRGPTTDFGIVDMDYDFDSKQIGEIDRMLDTNRSCCLFALVQNCSFGGDLISFSEHVILKLITNSSNEIIPRLTRTLKDNSTYFTALVRERTTAGLFRGYAQNELKVDKIEQGILRDVDNKLPPWSQIGDIDTALKDKVPEKLDEHYHDFKHKYKNQLENSGFNDHAFRDALIMLFLEVFDEDESPFEDWVHLSVDKWKTYDYIDAAITKVMIERGGSASGKDGPIASILKQIEDYSP